MCISAGLSIDDLKTMRIDQAEAIIELKQFIVDSATESDGKTMDAKSGESKFWGD